MLFCSPSGFETRTECNFQHFRTIGENCPLLSSFQRTQDFFDYLTPPLQPYLQFAKLFLYQYFKYLFLYVTNILPFFDIPKFIQIFSDFLTFIIYILK